MWVGYLCDMDGDAQTSLLGTLHYRFEDTRVPFLFFLTNSEMGGEWHGKNGDEPRDHHRDQYRPRVCLVILGE